MVVEWLEELIEKVEAFHSSIEKKNGMEVYKKMEIKKKIKFKENRDEMFKRKMGKQEGGGGEIEWGGFGIRKVNQEDQKKMSKLEEGIGGDQEEILIWCMMKIKVLIKVL